jgi:hypothetical protein
MSEIGRLRRTSADLSWTVDKEATAEDLERRKTVERLFSRRSFKFMLSNTQIQYFMADNNYRVSDSYNDGTIVYEKYAHIGSLAKETRMYLTPFRVYTKRREGTNLTAPEFHLCVKRVASAETEAACTYYLVRNIEQIGRVLKRWGVIPRVPKVRFVKRYDSDGSYTSLLSDDSVQDMEDLYRPKHKDPSPHDSGTSSDDF